LALAFSSWLLYAQNGKCNLYGISPSDDFFSRTAFDPATLAREIPYLAGAETVQLESHTLTCRADHGGPVLTPHVRRDNGRAP
jgi:hypothetical protein